MGSLDGLPSGVTMTSGDVAVPVIGGSSTREGSTLSDNQSIADKGVLSWAVTQVPVTQSDTASALVGIQRNRARNLLRWSREISGKKDRANIGVGHQACAA